MGWYDKTSKEREQEGVLRTRWSDIDQVVAAVRGADPTAIDRALAFLLEDPRYHGSGYQKEILWRRLARVPLAREQHARLEAAALDQLSRRLTREFWPMARTMAAIGTSAFWDDVKATIRSPDKATRRRAEVLAAYESGVRTGERARIRLKYGP